MEKSPKLPPNPKLPKILPPIPPKEPYSKIPPVHRPQPHMPLNLPCDPLLLKQIYHQMKICHKYELEMLKLHMKYCACYHQRKQRCCHESSSKKCECESSSHKCAKPKPPVPCESSKHKKWESSSCIH